MSTAVESRANNKDQTWTAATTETLGNVFHAAQDLVTKAEGSVGSGLGAVAETAKEYALSAKDQVFDAGTKMSRTISRVLSSDSLESSDKNAGEPTNAGEPLSPSLIKSPDLQPDKKKARVYTASLDSPDLSQKGLEANLDPSLVGPQRLATASPAPPAADSKPIIVNKRTERLVGHKRADSSDKYWKSPSFE